MQLLPILNKIKIKVKEFGLRTESENGTVGRERERASETRCRKRDRKEHKKVDEGLK
jgi:hypothetical protein